MSNPTLVIINYCPGDACDPCPTTCTWIQNIDLAGTITHFLLDGITIDQPNSFCGIPYFAIGINTDDTGSPGDLVSGHVDLDFTGTYAVPHGDPVTFDGNFPPAITLIIHGTTVFSLAPVGVLSGYSSAFTATRELTDHSFIDIGTWAASVRVSIPNCILVSPGFCYWESTASMPDPITLGQLEGFPAYTYNNSTANFPTGFTLLGGGAVTTNVTCQSTIPTSGGIYVRAK